MSEAIILYRGRGGISEEDKRPKVYTNNGVFKAPFTGNYLVSCVGGGGGGGGGCRNIWNSSQVYYGAGGSRGGFSSGNVWLNQGDEVTMTMGPGGSAGTNNTTVVSYNSRGTSGSAGSTTTFGSYKSAAGGSAGSYSWMWRSTYNKINSWNNTVQTTSQNAYVVWSGQDFPINKYGFSDPNGYTVYAKWTNWIFCSKCVQSPPSYPATRGRMLIRGYDESSFGWGGGIYEYNIPDKDAVYNNGYLNSLGGNLVSFDMIINIQCETCGQTGIYVMGSSWDYLNRISYNNAAKKRLSEMKSVINSNRGKQIYVIFWGGSAGGPSNSTGFHVGEKRITYNSNIPRWNNGYTNQTTRCYTSIQQGTWWYLNNNVVSTAGTRAYSGDGGQSGSKGNAGFILIYPQWSE